ncbi:SRPBCC family protein [Maribacter halichondriae]|uniref:SRPBCC family protein n=1 Tax=Maribacter halichondriae TaxID=2980554 RepID=UPI0023581D82|nr:SRPBCC family protein [Maribacter sp. Hal144]
MKTITVQTNINTSLEKAWNYWTTSKHITNWNFAIPEWHCPNAENDLSIGGKFSLSMEAKDGSMGFDYSGTYTKIEPISLIEYALEDGRKVHITFNQKGDTIEIIETFEVEDSNTLEQQRQGWQSILDNFKAYTENN